jgi:hypothetical protein
VETASQHPEIEPMQYLLSVIDDGQAEAADSDRSATLAEDAAIDDFNSRLRGENHWVFGGGLGRPIAATVVDNRGEAPILTDGPFLDSKEFLAGFWIQRAQVDGHGASERESRAICHASIAKLAVAIDSFDGVRIYDSTIRLSTPRLVAVARAGRVVRHGVTPEWLEVVFTRG